MHHCGPLVGRPPLFAQHMIWNCHQFLCLLHQTLLRFPSLPCPIVSVPSPCAPLLPSAAATAAPMRMLAAARCAAAMPVTSCSLTSLAHPVAACHLHRLGAETFTRARRPPARLPLGMPLRHVAATTPHLGHLPTQTPTQGQESLPSQRPLQSAATLCQHPPFYSTCAYHGFLACARALTSVSSPFPPSHARL
jgi:hypothetical protein